MHFFCAKTKFMLKNIVLITDYGTGDPAFVEVTIRLKSLLPESSIIPISTPPFSTINTGFWIYQVALAEEVKNTYIFSNTAPRKDDLTARRDNIGEKLMYAKLDNGFEIMAVNAGYSFSFVKPHIELFYYVDTQNHGSQFRSRDYYPKMVAKMIERDRSFLGERVDPSLIPNYPKDVIASIDGYGNLKTTIRASDAHSLNFEESQKITIEINGKKHIATYTDGIFNAHDGDLVFAPGSSGYHDRFMEISLRGGSARQLFEGIKVEDTFKILRD